jgi:hypothetical protein
MEIFGMSWNELKTNFALGGPMKKEMIEKYGGIRSRNGNDNDKPLGDRFVDQNIIKKWDNEARAKLKLLKNEKEKE